uniref:XPG N-terminal domain-containing protein n=1 Tax=viral metagenome TaxID=1070528 RepID=A0A6C0AZ94_9ZZZZ
MGIRCLNKFLKENCSSSIQTVSLSKLNGKTIVIDASIYLYKYSEEGKLMENMNIMLSMFKLYNIVPIFIFDGKPPAEKKELLKQRREDKKIAENEFHMLHARLGAGFVDDAEKQEINNAMNELQKKFIHVTKQNVENVKELLNNYGVTYYVAPGEADGLCALLAVEKKAWACLSEDMDMFVYGCPRVLRYLNLNQHNVVLYTMTHILQDLQMTQKEFRQVCILSGTDYNKKERLTSCQDLYHTISLFKKYKRTRPKIDFYTWLDRQKQNYYDISELQHIYTMFDVKKSF